MWLRLDDAFADHPKVVSLSDAAFRLHIRGMCYSARYLTDGAVLSTVIRPSKVTKELTKAGLWSETSTGWTIHDFLEYNPSRAHILEERRKARERRSPERNPTDSRTDAPASPAPSRPLPQPEKTQEPPPPAANLSEENGWKAPPNGWTDDQYSLWRKLFARDSKWAELTPGGLNRLSKVYGKAVTTTAMRDAWEEVSDGSLLADGPYPLLESICRRVKTGEKSA
jgi:hypothetical protein